MQNVNTIPASSAGNAFDPVERARITWMNNLIDVSRRNNLLYYRQLKRGALDLSSVDAGTLDLLLSGAKTPLSQLARDADLQNVWANAREIQRRALANREERGLETLFLVYGFARWSALDDSRSGSAGRPYQAAVVLLPASIELRARDIRAATVQIVGEPQANLVLLHVLATDYNCLIDAEELVADATQNDGKLDPDAVLDRLASAARAVPDFGIERRIVLSNFTYQKMSMVADLQQNGDRFAGHPVLSAMAGDLSARRKVTAGRADIDARALDSIPSEREFLVLDADSTQQRVVHSALRLQSGVIQGPPGTGKSQTIVNMIAALVANGRRVLFVAEKRAALDVVLNRLQNIGLGHLALDLHGAEATRASVLQRIGASKEVVASVLPVNSAGLHERFENRRARLNSYVAQLHDPRQPAQMSVYEMEGYLLRARPEVRIELRWRSPDLDRLTLGNVRTIRDLLTEAAGLAPLIQSPTALLWSRALLADGVAAQQAADVVQRIARSRLPDLRSHLERIAQAVTLDVPDNLSELTVFLDYLARLDEFLKHYSRDILAEDLSPIIDALMPAGNIITHVAGLLVSSKYRAALEKMKQWRVSGSVNSRQLAIDASIACELQRIWRQNSRDPSIPDALPDYGAARQHVDMLRADLDQARVFLGDLIRESESCPLSELADLLDELASDLSVPRLVARAREIDREIEGLGGGRFLHEARRAGSSPDLWADQFEYAWIASCLEDTLAREPALSSFVGDSHNRLVNEFRQLDRSRVALAVDRVRRAHAEWAVSALNQHTDQLDLVERELAKKRRHLPLRRLLSMAPDVLTAVCPCWMASPLSVSQLLPADRRYFDVVLFDEASQIPPEDAVPAIMRASHVIVAGDKHQLPPTRFFAAEDPDTEAEDDIALPTEGFESLLDLMNAFLENWWLGWHYRSRDESLIAFSNRHIYGDRLITFPGPGGSRAISHVLVEPDSLSRPCPSEGLSVNLAEARRVVELVLEHARTRPQETLGVIALGIRHANLIQEELDQAMANHPELEDFFSQERPERFFVKNLERVQGDERDAIILSVGYGKDSSGRLPYRFGPLLQDGGERRLNVAVTRARCRLTLVSSFTHLDMDPDRSKARGVELLRLYLEYAARQGKSLSETTAGTASLTPFEADVYEALSAKGIPLVPQFGASGCRIGFAARHPESPEKFVLAVECDGPAYRAMPTARDRDRLRQQQLEALGWAYHRIWSPDWYFRRDQEIDRALAAYRQAAQGCSRPIQFHSASGAPSAVASAQSLTPRPGAVFRSSVAPARGPKPAVPRRARINEYTQQELVALVQWINSDGLLRTDEQIIDELMDELGFKRRGARIDEAIRGAIAQVARAPGNQTRRD